MKAIASLMDYASLDGLIAYLKLSFMGDKPPAAQLAYQEVLMSTDTSAAFYNNILLPREI